MWAWLVDDADDAVWGGEHAALHVDGLASVGSLVDWLSIMNRQCTVASFRSLKTPWWLTDWSPIQTPIDVWLWNGDSLTGQRERVSTWHLKIGLWWIDDGWLDASDLIGTVVTIVGAVAVE